MNIKKRNLMKKNLFLLSMFTLCIAAPTILSSTKSANDFRDYENAAESVHTFYRLNHTNQTLRFVLAQKKKYYPLNKMRMNIWDAMAVLDTIVDESDPDLD